MKGNCKGQFTVDKNQFLLHINSLADGLRFEVIKQKIELLNDKLDEINKKESPTEQANTIQQDRENALRALVEVMEANAKAKGQIFNPMRLACSKLDMLEMLKQREPKLFSGMSEEQFNKFWIKQQVCKLKPGKPLGSGSQ